MLRKNIEKTCQNDGFWPPKSIPNRAKIDPKSMVKKHRNFHRFLIDIWTPGSWKNCVSLGREHNFFYFRFLARIHCRLQKSTKKRLNEVQTTKKSCLKTFCFSTSMFLRFGPHFEGIGGFKWWPRWLQKRKSKYLCGHWGAFESIHVVSANDLRRQHLLLSISNSMSI